VPARPPPAACSPLPCSARRHRARLARLALAHTPLAHPRPPAFLPPPQALATGTGEFDAALLLQALPKALAIDERRVGWTVKELVGTRKRMLLVQAVSQFRCARREGQRALGRGALWVAACRVGHPSPATAALPDARLPFPPACLSPHAGRSA
jgi:hypothetical protein